MPVCPAAPVCACARLGGCRPRHYPSDTTDAEWMLLTPLLPVPACQTPAGGRPETNCRRAVVDAIRYVIHNGCVWRAVPADFPPWRTVYGLYQRWNAAGVTIALHDALRAQVRLAAGRAAEPTAAVLDSQSVRAAATVPKPPGAGITLRRSTAASGTSPSTPAACWKCWPPRHRRLRTPPRLPRSHRLLGHDHRDDPPPGPPPAEVRNKY